jgi:Protein of unknown function (DUF3300)
MNLAQMAGRILLSFLLILTAVPANLDAQNAPSPGNQNDYAPLTPEDLDNLVAPIALYPDPLVAQVLGAATFPDQVTDANAWLKQNSRLTGEPLMRAVDQQTWDPAVKALTQFPTVLDDLAKNLAWTSALGEAAATQQPDVMAAVQRMRAKAYAAGNLKSGSQIKVVQESPQTIVIQPANPQVVYVPAYNPTVIYGAPVVVPGYSASTVAAAAIISFGVGIAVGSMVRGGCCGWGWGGWGTNWGGNTIVYNRNVYVGNNYWRGGYAGGYRPGYPAYRPGNPAYRPGSPNYRPGYPGYGRPPVPPAGTRPPYPTGRPPANGAARPTPYPSVQDKSNRPVNPANRPNTTAATQPKATNPVPRQNATRPSAQPNSSELRGYQRPQNSGSSSGQSARPNAFSASSSARAQSARGKQSLAANGGGKVAKNR